MYYTSRVVFVVEGYVVKRKRKGQSNAGSKVDDITVKYLEADVLL